MSYIICFYFGPEKVDIVIYILQVKFAREYKENTFYNFCCSKYWTMGSSMLGKGFTTELYPQPFFFYIGCLHEVLTALKLTT